MSDDYEVVSLDDVDRLRKRGRAHLESVANAAPTWARRLRAEQSARHQRQTAMQTIKDGDRPGGAANPDLSEKD